MKHDLAIPGAIILAGVIIAGAIIFTNAGGDTGQTASPTLNEGIRDQEGKNAEAQEIFNPVSKDDHIRGNIDAPVTIVEYSDLECPFCKRFHGTMARIVDEYDDEVAWVYRHAPIVGLHSKAIEEAVASECAAKLGGEQAFWAYVDRLFEITPSNNGLNLDTLPRIAEHIGLNPGEFRQCLARNTNEEKINDQLHNGRKTAAALGIRFGTPFSVLVEADGTLRPIAGAKSYEAVEQLVEEALAQ